MTRLRVLLTVLLLLLVSPAHGVTSIVALSSVARPAGTYPFGPIAVPVGATAVQVVVDRTTLASGTAMIFWQVEFSTDSGVTWNGWDGLPIIAGSPGGSTLVNPLTALPFTESWLQVALKNPSSTTRQVRGSVTFAETVITTITIRFLP